MKKKINWDALITAFEDSGLTQSAYCLKHGVSLGSFRKYFYAARKFAREEEGFTQLTFSETPDALQAVELQLPNGILLRFSGLVSPEYLVTLVGKLRA
jgi:hypothetical protein